MKTANGLWFRKNQHIWIQTVATGTKQKWHRGKLKNYFPGLYESLERVAKANEIRHVLVEGTELDAVMDIEPYDCSFHEPRSLTGCEPGNPALQNMPIRTEPARRIRDAFAGQLTLIEADYSELEMRFVNEAMNKKETTS